MIFSDNTIIYFPGENYTPDFSSVIERGYEIIDASELVSKIPDDILSFFAPGSQLSSISRFHGPACFFQDKQLPLDPDDMLEILSDISDPIPLPDSFFDIKASKCFDDFCVVGSQPGSAPYRSSENDIERLIDELQRVKEENLRELGISEETLRFLLNFRKEPSKMVISRNAAIYLPDYGNLQIDMDVKTKALYLLFLRHEEGIQIKDLPSYADELMSLYSRISGRDNPDAMRATIKNLVDPFKNDINISLSRIKRAFSLSMADSLARNYYVDGRRGGVRSISLDRNLVTFLVE